MISSWEEWGKEGRWAWPTQQTLKEMYADWTEEREEKDRKIERLQAQLDLEFIKAGLDIWAMILRRKHKKLKNWEANHEN